MLGVVGPFIDDSEPYDSRASAFSRFCAIDRFSPEEEVKWVHEKLHLGRFKKKKKIPVNNGKDF
jgi:hypothetical protein